MKNSRATRFSPNGAKRIDRLKTGAFNLGYRAVNLAERLHPQDERISWQTVDLRHNQTAPSFKYLNADPNARTSKLRYRAGHIAVIAADAADIKKITPEDDTKFYQALFFSKDLTDARHINLGILESEPANLFNVLGNPDHLAVAVWHRPETALVGMGVWLPESRQLLTPPHYHDAKDNLTYGDYMERYSRLELG